MRTVAPFPLPLTPEQFTRALHCGLGRALLHVRAFGLSGIEEAVFDACLHDRAFDPQCEGDRTDWLLELVDAGAAIDRFAQRLIPEFDSPTPSSWDAQHRCRMARRLAQRGYAQARHWLYEALSKEPNAYDAGAEVISLDGEAGLLRVADLRASRAEQDPEFPVDDLPLYDFEETHGAGAVRRVLERAAENSPSIGAFLRRLDEIAAAEQIARAESLARRDPVLERTAAEVVRRIETDAPDHDRYWYVPWGRHASLDSVRGVLAAMTLQTEPDRLCKYLRVLLQRALPEFDAALLPYADHESAQVRRVAYAALSHYSHPEVRKLALARLSAGRITERELDLFEKNYIPSDAEVIERALFAPEDPWERHGVVSELVTLFEENPGAELDGCLLFAYEHSPCMNCREHAVQHLASLGARPAWLVEECRFDGESSIRAAAQNA